MIAHIMHTSIGPRLAGTFLWEVGDVKEADAASTDEEFALTSGICSHPRFGMTAAATLALQYVGFVKWS